jgi:hypothetical protein
MAVRRVLGNAVNLPGTTHTYSPNVTGTSGHDQSFITAHGTDGAGSHLVSAIHVFATPRDIAQLKYRLYSHGYAYGDDTASVTVEYQLLYTTNGSDWITITESTA